MIRTYVREDANEEQAKQFAWELIARGFQVLSIEEHNFKYGKGFLVVIDTEGTRNKRLPEVNRL